MVTERANNSKEILCYFEGYAEHGNECTTDTFSSLNCPITVNKLPRQSFVFILYIFVNRFGAKEITMVVSPSNFKTLNVYSNSNATQRHPQRITKEQVI